MEKLKKWKQKLQEIDSLKNHRKTLKLVLKSYLTSPAADDTSHRTDIIYLFQHLKKMLK